MRQIISSWRYNLNKHIIYNSALKIGPSTAQNRFITYEAWSMLVIFKKKSSPKGPDVMAPGRYIR